MIYDDDYDDDLHGKNHSKKESKFTKLVAQQMVLHRQQHATSTSDEDHIGNEEDEEHRAKVSFRILCIFEVSFKYHNGYSVQSHWKLMN